MEDFQYAYPFASVMEEGSAHQKSFIFSHCSELKEDNAVPCFFWGNIQQPFVVAKCLATLAKTVASQFAIAPGVLAKLRDPIISVGNQQLLFEAFSSCNSVYARVSLRNEVLDGEFLKSGCTNIDFNDHTVRAFNAVTASERMVLGVGQKHTHFITTKHKTVEKKVSLPNRWIKGLGNVQVYLSEMDLAHRLSKAEAIQLFRSLPKQPVKTDYYLVKRGVSYAFAPTPSANAIKVGGVHRLNLLQGLLLLADSLYIYRNASEQSVAFVLNFKGVEMLFLLSENVYRGFSGEGKYLENMTQEVPMEWLVGINNFFKTNEVFSPTMVSIENDISLGTMATLQASLSSIGLLGYNLLEGNYFYRRLPFKPDRLASLNPRLQNAKKLTANNEVQIVEQHGTYVKANVKGTAGVTHTVILDGDHAQCTCNWYTNHQTNRGLCKHILATKMMSQ
ncbi:MAG: SWIM zinc finger family protein [Capnocytophaga sp.]|nr:SWIM zinc finger family protein [Capnocytophaga sp.]